MHMKIAAHCLRIHACIVSYASYTRVPGFSVMASGCISIGTAFVVAVLPGTMIQVSEILCDLFYSNS